MPLLSRSTKNSSCFSKCFQFCASPLWRPARAHCMQQLQGQPWLELAGKFCISMCVTLLPVSSSICLHLPLQLLQPQVGEALVLKCVLLIVMLLSQERVLDLSADLLLILLCFSFPFHACRPRARLKSPSPTHPHTGWG